MVKVADLMPALVAILVVVHLGLEALPLGPAEIHAEKHLGPVLALGAAGAGMHGDDGVERVGFAVEHGAGFELFSECGEGLDVALEIGKNVFAFAGEFEVGFDVAGAAHEFLIVGDHRFEALAVAHDGLAGGGVVPQSRIGELGFYVGEFPADASRVKDTPAGRGPWSLKKCIAVPVHPTFFITRLVLLAYACATKSKTRNDCAC